MRSDISECGAHLPSGSTQVVYQSGPMATHALAARLAETVNREAQVARLAERILEPGEIGGLGTEPVASEPETSHRTAQPVERCEVIAVSSHRECAAEGPTRNTPDPRSRTKDRDRWQPRECGEHARDTRVIERYAKLVLRPIMAATQNSRPARGRLVLELDVQVANVRQSIA